jgi:predicted Fe-Mo cluster-binding NifX family protein
VQVRGLVLDAEGEQLGNIQDGMVLITAEAGEGFTERLARRGTKVQITSETDPETAVALYLDGRLPTLAPTPKEKTGCTAGAKKDAGAS